MSKRMLLVLFYRFLVDEKQMQKPRKQFHPCSPPLRDQQNVKQLGVNCGKEKQLKFSPQIKRRVKKWSGCFLLPEHHPWCIVSYSWRHARTKRVITQVESKSSYDGLMPVNLLDGEQSGHISNYPTASFIPHGSGAGFLPKKNIHSAYV